jgi:hypothetical protein
MTEPHTPWQSLRQRWQQVQQVPDNQALASPCMSVCIMKNVPMNATAVYAALMKLPAGA